jgi:periplasmic mercuric ion binding protein
MRLICKLIALTLLPVASAFAGTQATVLDLENMTCSLCGLTVKKALQKVPGVDEAAVDYPAKTATVKYDASKTNVGALVKATTDAGFPSTPRR